MTMRTEVESSNRTRTMTMRAAERPEEESGNRTQSNQERQVR